MKSVRPLQKLNEQGYELLRFSKARAKKVVL